MKRVPEPPSIWRVVENILGENPAEDKRLHRAVMRLSRSFTEEREALPRDYFRNDEVRRAYLAYFLPLNFHKTCTVLASSPDVWPRKPLQGQPSRWIDFGCGPGTATLAALDHFRRCFPAGRHEIRVDLVDAQEPTLRLARELVSSYAERLGLDVRTECLAAPPDSGEYDLALAVNVLNEMPPLEEGRDPLVEIWNRTIGTMLLLEPGHRVSSQRLVRLRQRLLKAPGNSRILGPCAHHERCPVYRTKHWCHFSEPLVDGRMIDLNLRIFRNPRTWLKFSYLLLTRGTHGSWDQATFRAIGDVHPSGASYVAIDLCQPETKLALRLPRNLPPPLKKNLVRGALVTLGKGRRVTAAKPISSGKSFT